MAKRCMSEIDPFEIVAEQQWQYVDEITNREGINEGAIDLLDPGLVIQTTVWECVLLFV